MLFQAVVLCKNDCLVKYIWHQVCSLSYKGMYMIKTLTKLILLFFAVNSVAMAQHIGASITNKGIQTILTSAINSYSNGNKSMKKMIVPKGTIYDRINKQFFDTNPIVSKIRQFINFEQNEDLVFYFSWSPITIDTNLVPKSLKVNVSGEQRHFSAAIKFSLNKLNISGRYLEICELKKWKCDKNNALYGRFNGYSLRLNRGSQIDIAAVIDVKVTNGHVEIKMKHFFTNLKKPTTNTERSLYAKYGISTSNMAKFDITFDDFVIPPPTMTINGNSFDLDVSKLKDAILSEKQYLSSQLATFAGRFVTKDLTNILNKDFFKKLKDLKTTINLLDYDETQAYNLSFADYRQPIRNSNYTAAAIDNTYVAPTLDYRLINQRLEKSPTFMEQLQGALKMLIHQASFDLTYTRTKTKDDKDLLVDFSSAVELNHYKRKLTTSLRNGKGKLKYPSFNGVDTKKYDIGIAISEPLVNGVLALADKENLIQNIIDEVAPMPGVYINNVRMHFEEGKNITYKIQNNDSKRIDIPSMAVDNTYVAPSDKEPREVYNPKTKKYKTIQYRSNDAIVAVVNMKVNLYEQASDGVGEWIENQLGGLLEGGWVWFPIEVKFYPQIVKEEGKIYIELHASDPFTYNGLRNTYGYPYKDMKNIVHKGLLKKLKNMLKPTLLYLPRVDISSYLSFPGIEIQPVSVYVKKTGHLLITANITKLNLKELSKTESK